VAGRFGGALLFAAALSCAVSPLFAQVVQGPAAAGYVPQDKLERNLWFQMDEEEQKLKESRLVIRDPALNDYVRHVLCQTVGEDKCGAARIYIVRTAQFNASMAPNGMMQVWTGLLLRMRSEAQLGAVLGHEFAHFEHQHTVKQFRDLKSKTDTMAIFSFLPYGAGLLVNLGIAGSIPSFSRDMEREADLDSVKYLAHSPYSTMAATEIWSQMREEQDATALARGTASRKDKNGGFFATHPNSAERVSYLNDEGRTLVNPGGGPHAEEYRKALEPWWPQLIDDQLKINDFGGTEFLLDHLASSGWTGDLLYARGELYRNRGAGDDYAKAAGFYRDAIAQGLQLPEVWRGLGLTLFHAGQQDEGRTALRKYLERRPDAGDRAMIAMMIGGA
jgi:hypothetical protein